MKQSKKSTISSFGWKFFERISVQGTNFIVTLILARLLTPSEYGLVSLILVFTSLAAVFVQGGFNTGTELYKLYTDDKYAERAGEEVLEMGGGYGSMTLHALDTVLGGVIGFKEAAASRVMAKKAREAAAMDVWNNNISLKGDLNSILSRRMDSGKFNEEEIGANVYSAVSAKNNFFASNGGKNLYSADALSILSMIEGKDAKDIFDEYGLTNIPKDNEIINAKALNEFEIYLIRYF